MKPVIFQKFMKWFPREHSPRVLFCFDAAFLYNHNQKRKSNKIYSIDFYENFWFETQYAGFHCLFTPNTPELKILVLHRDGSPDRRIDADVSSMDAMDIMREEDQAVLFMIMYALNVISEAKEKRTSVFTGQRNKASVYYKAGDDVKFHRIFNMKLLPAPEYEPPEPGASGIKKKQHDVIGHWRTYKTGVKVYVRPHKRGNPDLGTTTKLFT